MRRMVSTALIVAFIAAVSVAAPVGAAERRYEVMHETQGAEGFWVQGALAVGADGAFYGTARIGGQYFKGSLYRMQADGTFNVLHHFSGGEDGGWPQGLTQGQDGSLYGVTNEGGAFGCGVAYRVNPDRTMTMLHTFNPDKDLLCHPHKALLAASDGRFYGITRDAVFRMSLDGTVEALHFFSAEAGDGREPSGRLVEGRDGHLYGTTQHGGLHRFGTVFRMNRHNGSLVTLHHFDGLDGARPASGLTEGPDGFYYGVVNAKHDTQYGRGLIYRVGSSGGFEIVHDLATRSAGKYLAHELRLGRDGAFYGTTVKGGKESVGIIFRVTTDRAFSNLRSFRYTTDNGQFPQNELVEGADGEFIGVTAGGGQNGYGVFYRFRVTEAP
jgi:uncharacterized repeat protein (TIGR03803 family)